MKVLLVLGVILASTIAKPSNPILLPRTSFLVPATFQTQFHSQDDLGQYSYGYSDPLSAKQEYRSFDGVTRGSYSYVDAEGKLQSVDYTADDLNGFRVAATNLPIAPKNIKPQLPSPVEDTPEVAHAKEAHLAAVNEVKSRTSLQDSDLLKILPKPVEDTPEVAKAKSEHLEAKKFEELRHSAFLPSLHSVQYNHLPYATLLRTVDLPHGFAYSVNSPYVHHSRFLPTPVFF